MDYEKKIKNALSDKSVPFEVQAWLEEQFPELKCDKEYEDKDILNAIAEGVQYCKNIFVWSDFGGVPIDVILEWIEKQGEQTLSQTNERDWLYLVCDVLTWKDGIGQYLDDPRVQELAKKLRNEYAQRLTKQKPADKVKPNFRKGDWVVVDDGRIGRIIECTKDFADVDLEISCFTTRVNNIRSWSIQDAKDGDVLACNEEILLFKSYSVQNRLSLYCWYNGQTNNFHDKEVTEVAVTTRNKICPATKEQRDTLFAKMKDAGYAWDAEKKELKKIMES